jgi:hypothetical protein
MAITIKVRYGKEVSVDEFISWNQQKQQNQLRTKEQIEVTNKKISEKNGRKVITPKGIFPTLSTAAKAVGMNRDRLSKLIYNTAVTEYRYMDRRSIDDSLEFYKPLKITKITHTPIGQFRSNREAIKALKIKSHEFTTLLRTNSKEYFVRMSDGSVPSSAISKYASAKRVQTPLGTFLSKADAAKAHNIPIHQLTAKMLKFPNDFFLN